MIEIDGMISREFQNSKDNFITVINTDSRSKRTEINNL